MVFAPSVLIVGAAYARLATLFTSSQRIEGMTLTELKQRVREAATTAADQEQADREVEARLSQQEGWSAGRCQATGLKMRR